MNAVEPQRELFVLGVLRRNPASAYSIHKAMREHSPLYRSFKQRTAMARMQFHQRAPAP
jgi:hypothetical protein